MSNKDKLELFKEFLDNLKKAKFENVKIIEENFDSAQGE